MTSQDARSGRPAPTWVYIGGYGRSGSTLLGRLLGGNEEFHSAGELVHLLDTPAPGETECSCGHTLRQCPFWSRVLAGGATDVDPWRPGNRWSSLVRVSRRRQGSESLRRAAAGLERLGSRIADVSGARFIIDSSGTSRQAGRPVLLARHTNQPVRFIHLIRDGRGVMWSAIEARRRSSGHLSVASRTSKAIRAVIGWSLANTAAAIAGRLLGPDAVRVLTYEELADRPRETIRELVEWLGGDPTVQPDLHREASHEVGGNRMRFAAVTEIVHDRAWRSNLTRLERAIFWILGWPWALRHGLLLRHETELVPDVITDPAGATTETVAPKLWYLSLSGRAGDGAGTHVSEITAGLRRCGWDVTLIEPRFRSSSPARVIKLWQFFATQWRLSRSLGRRPRRGVLYIRTHPLTLWSVRMGARRGLAVVSEVNGPISDADLMFPRFPPARWLLRYSRRTQVGGSTALVTVSRHIEQEINAVSSRPVEIITSAANVEVFRPGAPCSIPLPRRFVLYFGALAPWQAIGTILGALDDPAWPERVSLVVAGRGPLRSLVEDAAGRDPRIRYLGELDQRELAGVVARALAGLSVQDMTMRHDTTPTKLFETMAAGIPVIVSDIPGQRSIVAATRSGLIVPPVSSRDLAVAVAMIDADDDERMAMGRRARQAVLDGNTWQARAEQTDAFLRSLIAI